MFFGSEAGKPSHLLNALLPDLDHTVPYLMHGNSGSDFTLFTLRDRPMARCLCTFKLVKLMSSFPKKLLVFSSPEITCSRKDSSGALG